MVKLTVLYGHPTDPSAFEAYYAAVHMPLGEKIAGIERYERAKVVGTPSGDAPAYYRVFEFWFHSPEQLQASMGSAEGQAAVADLAHFATGGVTILVSAVE